MNEMAIVDSLTGLVGYLAQNSISKVKLRCEGGGGGGGGGGAGGRLFSGYQIALARCCWSM